MKVGRPLVFLLAVIVSGAMPPAPARAAGVVTNCGDFWGPGGLGAAVATSGVVTFACSGTIAVPAQIEISAANSPLVIDGSGQNVTLTGSGGTRLFRVGSNRSLTLRNLTLRDGKAENGGAILALGSATVTLERVVFLDNRADSWGGALYLESGTAAIRHSRFEGNRLTSPSGLGGGAIRAIDMTLTIEASTFISNSAVVAGVPDTTGGAIDFAGGLNTATIQNSTFVSNTAGIGGAIAGSQISHNQQSIIRLHHLTLVENAAPVGSAIAAQTATVRLANSVIAGPGPRCAAGTGVIVNDGGNWESGAGAAGCGSSPPQVVPRDDLALGTLGDYGGTTPTIPLGTTSIARASGVAAFCQAVGGVDQRGARRPATHCSSGAYQQASAPVVTGVSPSQVPAGSPSVILTITGSHFIPGSTLRWNGIDVGTTWVNSSTLTATIPAGYLLSGGEFPLTVRYPGLGDLDSSPPITITVARVSQSITVASPPSDRPLGAGPFTLSATASSGLPVSIVSTTPAVCTASGTTITVIAPGVCSLTLSQPGNGIYLPAPDVVVSFTVTAPTPTPTPTPSPAPTATPTAAPTNPNAPRPPDLRPGTGGLSWLAPIVYADTRLNGEVVPFRGE
ncbi:MAG: choice-of-anchor Q domain-containing protein [Chloroflexota bacterium]|nr:hypothetical protein [Dehalococcoidia bacterium]MDW8253553.1 choice-of-anchor Q domain-containing protein [Chloroflexota bacterium]